MGRRPERSNEPGKIGNGAGDCPRGIRPLDIYIQCILSQVRCNCLQNPMGCCHYKRHRACVPSSFSYKRCVWELKCQAGVNPLKGQPFGRREKPKVLTERIRSSTCNRTTGCADVSTILHLKSYITKVCFAHAHPCSTSA